MKHTSGSGIKYFLLLAILLLALVPAGCGRKAVQEDEDGQSVVSPVADEKEDDAPASAEPLKELTEEELAALQYAEIITVVDSYRNKAKFKAFAPKGAKNDDGFVFNNAHGLTYSAYDINIGTDLLLDQSLNETLGSDKKAWKGENFNYTDEEFGGIIEKGEDKYCIATAMNKSISGTPYAIQKVTIWINKGRCRSAVDFGSDGIWHR